CCFQHRKCYEEATDEECMWDPAKITMDVSCLTKNLTCDGFLSFPESDDSCELFLCNCDKAAIECFLHSQINASMNSLDVSLCPSLVTEFQQQRTEDTQLTDTSVAEAIPPPTNGTVVKMSGTEYIPSEIGDLLVKDLEEGGKYTSLSNSTVCSHLVQLQQYNRRGKDITIN
ncbi:hypothetical protein JD844_015632, partial [Phrynosoma platyrhinos]